MQVNALMCTLLLCSHASVASQKREKYKESALTAASQKKSPAVRLTHLDPFMWNYVDKVVEKCREKKKKVYFYKLYLVFKFDVLDLLFLLSKHHLHDETIYLLNINN